MGNICSSADPDTIYDVTIEKQIHVPTLIKAQSVGRRKLAIKKKNKLLLEALSGIISK